MKVTNVIKLVSRNIRTMELKIDIIINFHNTGSLLKHHFKTSTIMYYNNSVRTFQQLAVCNLKKTWKLRRKNNRLFFIASCFHHHFDPYFNQTMIVFKLYYAGIYRDLISEQDKNSLSYLLYFHLDTPKIMGVYLFFCCKKIYIRIFPIKFSRVVMPCSNFWHGLTSRYRSFTGFIFAIFSMIVY